MSALGIGVSTRDVETWHDQRSGRLSLRKQRKPTKLIEAEIVVEQAWRAYDNAVDDYVDGRHPYANVARLHTEAIAAERRCAELRRDWNQSLHASTVSESELD